MAFLLTGLFGVCVVAATDAFNSGFENAVYNETDDYYWDSAWNVSSNYGVKGINWIVTDETSHSGGFALKAMLPLPNSGVPKRAYAVVNGLTSGVRYEITGWVKIPETLDSPHGVILRPNTSDSSVKVNPPGNASHIQLLLSIYD